MKLSEYITELQMIENQHGDLECIYAVDEEGNAFFPVYYVPSAGLFDKESHHFIAKHHGNINAVCIN